MHQNPLTQFLTLLVPDQTFGALLGTADTVALFGLTSEYHIRKYREIEDPQSRLYENTHFVRRTGLDNVTRIYYTMEGLLKLCALGVGGDRARLVFDALQQWRPPAPIVAAAPTQVQPYAPQQGQLTSQNQGGFYAEPTQQLSGQAAGRLPAGHGGALAELPVNHAYPINSPGGYGLADPPPNHPAQIIAAGVEQALDRAFAKYGGGGERQDLNAHDTLAAMANQQERDLKLFQAAAFTVARAAKDMAGSQRPPETRILAIQQGEDRQPYQEPWLWLGGVAVAMVVAGISFWMFKAAASNHQPSGAIAPVQRLEEIA
jgi:hypothetical protein